MPDPIAQTTLRDTLSAQFDAAQSETVAVPVAAPAAAAPAADVQPAAPVAGETTAQAEQRARDGQGRFAAKDQAAQPPAAPVVVPDVAQPPAEPVARPTTWKRDYLPLYDKLAKGEALTPEEARKLAPYMVQREKEFATGVSTYKAEAANAKELQDAMTPFMADLQQHNIKPSTWIANLGNAHTMLVKGTPEQKLQMFSVLARQYGVPLAAIAQPGGEQVAPVVTQLMAQIDSLKSQVNTVTGWREQQEQQELHKEISKFQDAEKYPHFEAVRGDMAQLLESGVAKDLDQAYVKAVRLNDDVWAQEQERQASAADVTRQAADKAAAAATARTRAVSTRTATPSGTAVNSGAKDRRSALSEKFDAMGQARV